MKKLLLALGLLLISSGALPQTTDYPNPVWPKSYGAGGINTGQVTVLTSATLVAAARTGGGNTGRWFITLFPSSGCTGGVFFGNSSVTTGTGFFVPSQTGWTVSSQAAIYGIVSSTTCTVYYWETF